MRFTHSPWWGDLPLVCRTQRSCTNRPWVWIQTRLCKVRTLVLSRKMIGHVLQNKPISWNPATLSNIRCGCTSSCLRSCKDRLRCSPRFRVLLHRGRSCRRIVLLLFLCLNRRRYLSFFDAFASFLNSLELVFWILASFSRKLKFEELPIY